MKSLLLVAVLAGIVALGVLAFTLFRTPEAASAPIVAIPIATKTAALTPPASSPTPVPAAAQPLVESTTAPVATPTAQPSLPATSAPTPTPAQTRIFAIAQDGSEARFIIQEVLRGADKTVVGATDQVAGQIAIDPATPSNSQIGKIQVNARTLTTDSDMRNRAIKNQILRTNDFEFVTFEPTEVSGLPTTVQVGDTVTFKVTGNLTVTDVTREEVFDVTLTVASTDRIEGQAEVRIPWSDYGLRIPDSPSVDTVADDLILQLQFVANATA